MAKKLKFGSPAWRKKYMKPRANKRKANAGKRTRAGMPRERTGANRKVRKAKKAGHSAKAAHHAKRSDARAYQTPGHGLQANPSMRSMGKNGTGWISARRVKIVKRRGKPTQILIEKPGRR